MKRRTTLKFIYLGLRILVPIGLIGWLLSRFEWDKIIPLIKGIDLKWILAAFLCFLVAYLPQTIRWQYILKVKNLTIPFLKLWKLVLISLFVSNFLPTTIGGDLAKIAGVVTEFPSEKKLAGASVVADRLYNMAPMLMLFPITFFILNSSITNEPILNIQFRGEYPIVSMVIPPFALKFIEKLKKIWASTKEWFTDPACATYSLILTCASLGLSYLSVWFVLKAIGIEASYWQALSISILSYIAAIIPISINGIGVQEGSITYLLTKIGAGTDQAVAAAILIRFVTLAVSLLGGIALILSDNDILSRAQTIRSERQSEEKI